jgi:hypothetical protein
MRSSLLTSASRLSRLIRLGSALSSPSTPTAASTYLAFLAAVGHELLQIFMGLAERPRVDETVRAVR